MRIGSSDWLRDLAQRRVGGEIMDVTAIGDALVLERLASDAEFVEEIARQTAIPDPPELPGLSGLDAEGSGIAASNHS